MVKPDNSYDAKFFNKIASGLALDAQFNDWYLSWAVPEALKLIQLTEIINGLSYVTLTHTGLTNCGSYLSARSNKHALWR